MANIYRNVYEGKKYLERNLFVFSATFALTKRRENETKTTESLVPISLFDLYSNETKKERKEG